jgi:rusticyanin
MNPRIRLILIGFATLLVGGLCIGVALAGRNDSPRAGVPAASSESSYAYYQSMMRRFEGGSMMGGSDNQMMGSQEYRWMVGGSSAPGWMLGGTLPRYMMGTSTEPGEVMGGLFADAPGPRVSPSKAALLGDAIPVGATVNSSKNRITFSGSTVHLVVLASPPGGHDKTFRSSGLVDPAIAVRAGAHVWIEVVNADPDSADGLVVTKAMPSSSWAPMTTASPAFNGSAMWFLGNPTSAGLHVGTINFIAATPGTYQYLCAVPGHAQEGMIGNFVVTN